MFSNNGKISSRQAVRLLIMDLFTGACLFLPMVLPRVSGRGGLAALLLGLGLTWLDGLLLSKCLIQCHHSFIPELGDGWGGRLLRWLYGLRCFASYVFLLSVFTQVLNETFLYTMPKWIIMGGMILVLIYGGIKGLEVRARLSEILFYLILIPIILIGLFSLPEAQWSRLWTLTDTTFSGVFAGALITWVLMAPIEWMLYIAPENPTDHPVRVFKQAIAIGGGLILIIYLLCVAVLDVSGMTDEAWPTVILMQIVKIPGGFLSRQDGLMLSFWIFAMFISLSGALGHASELLKTGKLSIEKRKLIVLAVGGGVLSYLIGMGRQVMTLYFYGMILSGILLLWLIPLFFSLRGSKKRLLRLGLLVLLSGSLMGCEQSVELENREFIMAIGIDLGEEDNYEFTYAFPNLSELTGKGGGTKKQPLSLKAASLNGAEEQFNRMSDKVMDYGQVKVLVLGEDLVRNDQALSVLVHEIRNKPQMARTILMCQSLASAREIIEMDKNMEGSVGMYLEELFKNQNKEKIFNDFMRNMSADALPKVEAKENRILLW